MATIAGVRLVGGDGALVDLQILDGTIADITPSTGHSDDDGRWVMPGLWDNHVHWDQWALARTRLDLRAVSSASEAAESAGLRLRSEPPAPGTPLIGYGFHDALWPDTPTTELLDEVAPGTAVALYSNDLHCGWLNTAAWRLLGQDGGPAVVVEEAYVAVSQALREFEARTLPAAIRAAVADASSRGVVGTVELEVGDNIATWTARVADGIDGLRVECGVYPVELDLAISRGRPTGMAVEDTNGLVIQGPFKVMTDGSLGTRTAYCDAPYPGLEGSAHPHGILVTSPQELEPLMRRAWSHGLLPAIHAIGDQANAFALDVFSSVGCPGRIEHAQLIRPGDAARFAALHVDASVQPTHCPDDRDIADRYWPDRSERAYPYRSLHEAGVRLLFGSDAPVAPLDPWLTIANAVHRSSDGREPWHPEQHLPVRVALESSIRGPLPLSAGRPADLVVLDADPLALTPAELVAVRPYATMVAGRWTFGPT